MTKLDERLIHCQDCGIAVVTTSPRRLYCDDCAESRRVECQKTWRSRSYDIRKDSRVNDVPLQ